MLRDLHARGREAALRVLALIAAGAVAIGATLWTSLGGVAPYGLPFSIRGISAPSLTMMLNPSAMLLGIGGLVGFRTCCSLLVGSIVAYGVLAPSLVHNNHIRVRASVELAALPPGVTLPERDAWYGTHSSDRQMLEWAGVMSDSERAGLLSLSADPTYQEAVSALYAESQSPQPSYRRDLSPWLLWPGVTLIVVASLVSLGLSWRSVGAAFRRSGRGGDEEDGTRRGDNVPRTWFVWGLVGAAILSVVLQITLFDVVWWAGRHRCAVGIGARGRRGSHCGRDGEWAQWERWARSRSSHSAR